MPPSSTPSNAKILLNGMIESRKVPIAFLETRCIVASLLFYLLRRVYGAPSTTCALWGGLKFKKASSLNFSFRNVMAVFSLQAIQVFVNK
ncbi:hypothetical protein D3C76_1532150 [compost metagenome]